jgi:hypothetical protein
MSDVLKDSMIKTAPSRIKVKIAQNSSQPLAEAILFFVRFEKVVSSFFVFAMYKVILPVHSHQRSSGDLIFPVSVSLSLSKKNLLPPTKKISLSEFSKQSFLPKRFFLRTERGTIPEYFLYVFLSKEEALFFLAASIDEAQNLQWKFSSMLSFA